MGTPAPPTTASTAKTMRTTVTSTPRYRAMPAATPASIRSWMGRDNGCGSRWVLASGSVSVWWMASGFAVDVFMAPACCRQPGLGIRKTPDPTLRLPPAGSGSARIADRRSWRDDGYVEKPTGPVSGWDPARPAGPGQRSPVDDDAATHGPWPSRRRFRRRGLGRWARGPRSSGPLRRGREDRLAGGGAAGVAARTGVDVPVVRTVFVLASLLGGFGAAAYVLAWLLVPADGGDSNIAREALTDRRGIALAAGLGSLLVVVLLIASALGAAWLGNLAWPLVISAAGIVLIWRNAPADEQELMRRLAEPLPGLTDGNRRS